MQSVRVTSAAPLFRRENFFLFDPEQPCADPNALLKARDGQTVDPRSINHNCPICHRTLAYDLFAAHLKGPRGCYAKWRKVQLDITKKKFTGATPHA